MLLAPNEAALTFYLFDYSIYSFIFCCKEKVINKNTFGRPGDALVWSDRCVVQSS